MFTNRACMVGRRNNMGAFYGRKIVNGVINPKTGEAWTLEDVPTHWRAATAEWIEEHT